MTARPSSSRRAFVTATLGRLAAMPLLNASMLQPEVPTFFADVPPGATMWGFCLHWATRLWRWCSRQARR